MYLRMMIKKTINKLHSLPLSFYANETTAGLKGTTMKKIAGIVLAAFLGLSAPAFAQSKTEKTGNDLKKGAAKAWQGTKKGAKVVGNKTAEAASKGKAAVTDKKSNTWIGPEGQTIYISGDNRYYWINGKGKRIYVSEAALKAKS